MYLPEDNPGAFSLFVDWLYRSSLPAGHPQSYLVNLYHLWIFATKICLTKLADDVMDQIQDTCKKYNQFISDELLKEIWRLTETDSMLRTWAFDLKMYQMFENKKRSEDGGDTFYFSEDNRCKGLWEIFQNDFKLFQIFLSGFEYMAQHRDKDHSDPRRYRERNRLHCYYHSHKEINCVAACSNPN
jgi:hypothetical protein